MLPYKSWVKLLFPQKFTHFLQEECKIEISQNQKIYCDSCIKVKLQVHTTHSNCISYQFQYIYFVNTMIGNFNVCQSFFRNRVWAHILARNCMCVDVFWEETGFCHGHRRLWFGLRNLYNGPINSTVSGYMYTTLQQTD